MPATPILDLEQQVPIPRRPWLPKLIGVVIGLLVAAVMILADQGRLPNWQWPAFNGLLIIPAFYLTVAWHEAGHLLAAKAVGLQVGGVTVGGFVLAKSGASWTVHFDRRRWLQGGVFKPLINAPGFQFSRYIWVVAGGPSASAVLTLLNLYCWMRVGNGLWSWVGTSFWISLFIFVISVIPFSSGIQRSDGASLILSRRRAEAALHMRALELQTQEANGVLPRDWGPELIDGALAVSPAAPEYVFCQWMALYHFWDLGFPERALSHLENLLGRSANTGRAVRHSLYLEAASMTALLRRNPDRARVWRDRACKLQRPESLDFVEAAIAMSEGRYAQAVPLWRAAQERLVRKRRNSGISRFAIEKWTELSASCANRETALQRPAAPLD